jgi:hypothetical protein
MSWVTIIWAAVAAACLTLAAVYFLVWCTKPTERARLDRLEMLALAVERFHRSDTIV